MTLNEYQNHALETAIYPEKFRIIYPALGLAGETGEVDDKIKKVIRDNKGDFSDEETRKAIALELGDVAWYLAEVATALDMPEAFIMAKNPSVSFFAAASMAFATRTFSLMK